MYSCVSLCARHATFLSHAVTCRVGFHKADTMWDPSDLRPTSETGEFASVPDCVCVCALTYQLLPLQVNK